MVDSKKNQFSLTLEEEKDVLVETEDNSSRDGYYPNQTKEDIR